MGAGYFETLKRMDKLLLLAALILLSLGLITLASLSTSSQSPFFGRQILWVIIGLTALFLTAHFDYRILKNYGGLLLLGYLAVLALLVTLNFSGREIRGVVSWFRLGSFAVEPGEFMKVALILLLAKYFSRRHVEIYRLRNILISGLYAWIPGFLILIQPDLGTAVIIGAIWFGILLSSGIRRKHLWLFLCLALILSAVGSQFMLAPYQKARIVSFLNPWNDPLGSGYNAIQSMIAVGAGGVWGRGVGYGTQTHLNFLPEPATDFIFAAFAEEWGFLGVFFLLAVYAVFFWRLLRIGMRAGDNFARLAILGMSAMFFAHLLIHVGMNLGALPITGITLPFVSYGGSSLLSAMILVGIAESIAVRSLKGVRLGETETV